MALNIVRMAYKLSDTLFYLIFTFGKYITQQSD